MKSVLNSLKQDDQTIELDFVKKEQNPFISSFNSLPFSNSGVCRDVLRWVVHRMSGKYAPNTHFLSPNTSFGVGKVNCIAFYSPVKWFL